MKHESLMHVAVCRWAMLLVMCLWMSVSHALVAQTQPVADQPAIAYSIRELTATDWENLRKNYPDWKAISATEWKQLRTQLSSNVPSPALQPTGYHVENLTFIATLTKQSLQGTLRLNIAGTASEKQTLNLAPWPFLSESPTAAEQGKQPIRWGLNTAGQPILELERPGVYEWPVTLFNADSTGKTLQFRCETVPALARRFEITVPNQYVILPRKAVLVETSNVDLNSVRWVFQAPGQDAVEFQLLTQSSNTTFKPQHLLRPNVTYEIGTGGLQIHWESRWENQPKTSQELTIRLPRAVELLNVMWGDQVLIPRAVSPDQAATVEYRLSLPVRTPGSSPSLRIHAAQALVLDELRDLPIIQIDNQQLQDSNYQLVIAQPYELAQIQLQDCSIAASEKLVEPLVGRALRFQLTGPNPRIQTLTRWSKAQGTWSSQIELTPTTNSMQAKFKAVAQLDQGETDACDFVLDPNWLVADFKIDPPQLVREIQRIEQPASTTIYRVQFQRKLTAGEQFLVSCSATNPLHSRRWQLPWEQIDLCQLQQWRRTQSLLVFPTTAIGNWKLPNQPGLRPLTEQEWQLLSIKNVPRLTNAQVYSYPILPSGQSLEFALHTVNLPIQLVNEVVLTNEALVEKLSISLAPDARNPVLPRQLYVYQPQAQSLPITWSSKHAPQVPLVARQIPTSERAPEFPQSGDLWMIQLPVENQKQFQIQATRTFPFAEQYEVQGWQLLQQQTPETKFICWSRTANLPSIATEKLTQTTDSFLTESNQLLVGTWSEQNPTEHNSKLVVKRTTQQTKQPVIQTALLETYCQPAQNLHYQFRAQIYSELPTVYQFQLPVDRKLIQATLNNEAVDCRWQAERQQFEMVIPGKNVAQIIQLNWQGSEPQSNWSMTAVAEWPVSQWPILARQWLVMSPATCQPISTELLASIPESNWRTTFFNKLFHPVLNDWNQSRWWLEPYLPNLKSSDNQDASAAAVSKFWQRLAPAPMSQTSSAAKWNAACQAFLDDMNQQRRLYLDEQMLLTSQSTAQPSSTAAMVLIAWDQDFILTTWERLATLDQVQPHPTIQRLYFANTDRFTTSVTANSKSIAVTAWSETWQWPSQSFPTQLITAQYPELPGWVPYAIHTLDAGSSVRFINQTQLRIWSLFWFIVSLVLSVFWLTWRAATKLVTICLLCVGIALLSTGWAPLLVACTWGLFAGQMLRWFACWPWYGWFANDPLAQSTHRVSGRVTSKLAVSSIVLVSLICCLDLPAQVTDMDTASKPIFIVSDSNRDATSTTFVPPELLQRLQTPAITSPSNWLIQSATYEGKLELTTDQVMRPVKWLAKLRGINLQSKQWVRFNFTSQQIAILPDGVQINQQPVAWRWSKHTAELELYMHEAGPQDIELRFLPILDNNRHGIAWNWHIPAAPRNEFRLRSSPGIRLSTLLSGTWNWDEEQHLLVGIAGPTQQFPLLWQTDTNTDTRVQTETEISSWLKIRPGSSQLDVRIPIRVINGQLQRIQLALDERLELLAPTNDSGLSWQASKQGNTLEIEFKNAITDRAVLDLSFAVKSSADHTNWSMPKVELLGQVIKNQWLLVSADSIIELKENLKPQGLIASDLETFRRIWGTEVTRPAWHYQVVRPNYFWRFQAIPRMTQYRQAQAQAWQLYTTDTCDWGLLNRVEILQGSTWTLTTKLGVDWLPYQVLVKQQMQPIPCYWGLGKSGELTIFFDQPIQDEVQILLLGERKITTKTPILWTWPAWENQPPKQVEMLVARDQEATLQVNWPNKLTAVPRQEWPNWPEYWPSEFVQQQRKVRQHFFPIHFIRGITTEQPLVTRVNLNQIQGSLQLQSQLEKRQNTWWLNLQGVISLKQGTLDELELQLGLPLAPSSTVQPANQVQLLPGPTGSSTQLVVQPTRTSNQNYQFQCSLPINQPVNQALQWSATQLINSNLKLTEQLLLPTRQQSVPNWILTGLSPVTANQEIQPHYWPYQVTSAQAQAIERNLAPEHNQTRCLLANHQLQLSTQNYWGVTEFDLLTGSAQAVRIWLPKGLEWICDDVDGQNIPWQKAEIPETEHALIAPIVGPDLAGTMWEVSIAPHSVQRISIAYRDTREPQQIAQHPVTPLLVDLNADQTQYQWQIDSVDHPTSTDPVVVAKSLLVQLQTLDHILNWYLQQTNSTLNSEPSRPLEKWIQRWQLCWNRLDKVLLETNALQISTAELKQLDQQRQDQLAITNESLGLDPRFYTSSHSMTNSTLPLLVNYQPHFATNQISAAHQLYDQFQQPAATNWSMIWYALIGLLFTLGVGVVAYRTGWGNLLGRYPLLTLTMIAIVWWCWFTPREFSLLLLLIVTLHYWLKRRKYAAETDFIVHPNPA